jgi:hypothetical protein
MKHLLLAGAVALVSLSGSANAAAVILGIAQGGTPGSAADPGPFAGQTVKFGFDTAVGLSGSYAIFSTPSGTGNSAPPAGSANGNQYLSVANPAVSGSAQLDLDGRYDSVSFYWGSIDEYNQVDIVEFDGTVTEFDGNDLTVFLGQDPSWGNQSAINSNMRVNFGSGSGITELRFHTQNFAFEIDSVAVGNPSVINAVPEPATWAMMVGGFGMLGFAARRRSGSRTVLA